MRRILRKLKPMQNQTKFFVFMIFIYMFTLFWTTFQSYLRLSYSRSDRVKPIVINIPSPPP